jgi:hypothetical protein
MGGLLDTKTIDFFFASAAEYSSFAEWEEEKARAP